VQLKSQSKIRLATKLSAAATCLTIAAAAPGQAQTPPEPGATPGVELTNISKNGRTFASVFPQVAVSRTDPNLVAVAWRQYNLPIDTNAVTGRVAECHVAISRDGGKTWRDRNMMDMLRTQGPQATALAGCNAPWVQIANDGTMYFGGALFTAGGELMPYPKAGRAGVSVSTDAGTTWAKMVPGIEIARFMPGMRGLQNGMEPHHTPWDGANGVLDLQTSVFYSTAGAYISATEDKGKSFGTVYTGKGTAAAAFGKVVASRSVNELAGYTCPCLVFSITSDRGKTWQEQVIAQGGEYNSTGTIRYPITAASPVVDGHYAVTVYQGDHRTVKVYYTRDGAKTWRVATPRPTPKDVAVSSANQASTGFTGDGKVLVTWRGFRNPGAFNTFVAMLDGDTFGPTVKVSPELSIYPTLTYAGNYGNGNGGGDFTTWVTGNAETAFVAFPMASKGEVLDTYLARVPLRLLSASAAASQVASR
jgi:hypothetical protein